jgi:hypothetical protein
VEEAAFHAPLPSIVAANAEAGRLAEAAKVLKNQEDTLRVRAAEFAATAPREHAAWTIAGACSRDVARDVALTMRAEEAAEAVQKVREERVRVGVAEDAVEAVAAAEAEGEASHTPNLLSGMGIEEENELDAPRAAPVDPAKSPEFNDAEEDYHYGKPEYDEDGTAVQHVSAWLGLQALGIATAIVVGSVSSVSTSISLGLSSLARNPCCE